MYTFLIFFLKKLYFRARFGSTHTENFHFIMVRTHEINRLNKLNVKSSIVNYKFSVYFFFSFLKNQHIYLKQCKQYRCG